MLLNYIHENVSGNEPSVDEISSIQVNAVSIDNDLQAENSATDRDAREEQHNAETANVDNERQNAQEVWRHALVLRIPNRIPIFPRPVVHIGSLTTGKINTMR